jgi:hypothetical protein
LPPLLPGELMNWACGSDVMSALRFPSRTTRPVWESVDDDAGLTAHVRGVLDNDTLHRYRWASDFCVASPRPGASCAVRLVSRIAVSHRVALVACDFLGPTLRILTYGPPPGSPSVHQGRDQLGMAGRPAAKIDAGAAVCPTCLALDRA